MGFLKSVKTLGRLKGVKTIGTRLGKILPAKSRKVPVEESLASDDQNIDYVYYDDLDDLMSPLLSSNKNGKSCDPEHCHLSLPIEVLINGINDETRKPDETRKLSVPERNSSSSTSSVSSSTTNACETSPTFVCDMCVRPKHLEDSFDVEGCSHIYCRECIVEFVKSSLKGSATFIKCPEEGCCGVLDPEYCRPILPNEIYDLWGKALCENEIMWSETTTSCFYCPFADCSALLFLEEKDQNDEINQAQCPHCKRAVCANCKVPWHNEFDCEEFQRLRDMGEDEMVRGL